MEEERGEQPQVHSRPQKSDSNSLKVNEYSSRSSINQNSQTSNTNHFQSLSSLSNTVYFHNLQDRIFGKNREHSLKYSTHSQESVERIVLLGEIQQNSKFNFHKKEVFTQPSTIDSIVFYLDRGGICGCRFHLTDSHGRKSLGELHGVSCKDAVFFHSQEESFLYEFHC